VDVQPPLRRLSENMIAIPESFVDNTQPQMTETVARPFLKWAGSKTKVVKSLLPIFACGNGHRFIEPFVGSGVVFLNTNYAKSILSDTNNDIISLFSALKEQGKSFIERCKRLFTSENNSKTRFYELRDEFNKCHNKTRRATLFLYLNRHCFNGLCRFNKSGRFNTPFGSYGTVYFPSEEMEVFREKLLTTELRTQDFRATLAETGLGDIVYCDPPYVPLSKTANFTSYSAGGFSQQDQADLRNLCLKAARRGAIVLISNHDTPFTRDLYHNATEVIPILVSRTISCDGENRKKAKELIAVFRK